MARWAQLVCAGVLSAIGAEAHGVELPAHLAGRPELEVASGAPVRAARELSWFRAPIAAETAWRRLVAEWGPSTRAVWDPATGVPARIWGAGVAVPGSTGSARVAERAAREWLSRHIALVAPGASTGDFELVASDLDGTMRTLGFAQRWRGLPVIGGQLSFRFKNDRLFVVGADAMPHVAAPSAHRVAGAAEARSAAAAWVLADMATTARATTVTGPMVLPLIRSAGVSYRVVLNVRVEADDPLGVWDVYVDAASAEVVARTQRLRFATGTVRYNAPERWPEGTRIDYPAAFASLDVQGAATTSDIAGVVSWPGTAAASVTVRALGSHVDVDNEAGSDASAGLSLSDGGSVVWNEADDEFTDAQLSAYVHTNRVKEHLRGFAAELSFVDEVVPARVNIDNQCNAFYDNGTINFYRSSGECHNTALLGDVVYHEVGHMLHDNAIIDGVGAFDGALSEGLSDYLAATITGDPAMGIGFHRSPEPLRHIDPPGGEHVWPDDIGEIHYTGIIIAGALWDLRTLLIAEHGASAGRAIADQLFYQAQRRAYDIPTMYPEVLAADDDDGDLSNGTPNVCAINDAFGRHGLRPVGATLDAAPVAPPFADGYTVSIQLSGLFPQCPGDNALEPALIWQEREAPEIGGSLAMTVMGTDVYSADLPPQPDGSVVEYRVAVAMGDGGTIEYPQNPADRFYEMFIGHVEPIYCTDFETDPEAEGWTHGLTSGDPTEGADDWQWGAPVGASSSYDPAAAYSGTSVLGNDLGADNFNGLYQSDKTNFALSPTIDGSGYAAVRLHYRRWLSVEDGFFDQAHVYGNDALLWSNLDTQDGQNSTVHHVDREWVFHDVDLTTSLDPEGTVAVRFEIDTDGGKEFGGWTVDDVCVVGWVATVCGDGQITGLEECDDGAANSDSDADACRSICLAAACGDAVLDSGEECDDGNADLGDGCEDCAIAAISDPEIPLPDPTEPPLQVDDGCGCAVPGARGRFSPWILVAATLYFTRRRRRV